MSQEASARDVPVKACAEELTMDLTEFDVVTMVMRLVLKTHSGSVGSWHSNVEPLSFQGRCENLKLCFARDCASVLLEVPLRTAYLRRLANPKVRIVRNRLAMKCSQS